MKRCCNDVGWWNRRALLAVLSTTMIAACAAPQVSNKNQESSNQKVSRPNATNGNSMSKSTPSTSGGIEVTSSPSGARVLLVSTGEDGAGEPQLKGVTPTTITGLAPGKYTVDLEKSGYRFYQKEVDVKAGKTAKVAATLKKH